MCLSIHLKHLSTFWVGWELHSVYEGADDQLRSLIFEGGGGGCHRGVVGASSWLETLILSVHCLDR